MVTRRRTRPCCITRIPDRKPLLRPIIAAERTRLEREGGGILRIELSVLCSATYMFRNRSAVVPVQECSDLTLTLRKADSMILGACSPARQANYIDDATD